MANIDRKIYRLWKGRTLLYVVIGDELEDTPLRENCCFVIDGAIFETEEQAGGDPVSMDDLEEVPYRYYAALFCPQREKSVYCTFHVAHRNGLRWPCKMQGTKEDCGE